MISLYILMGIGDFVERGSNVVGGVEAAIGFKNRNKVHNLSKKLHEQLNQFCEILIIM